MSLHPPKKAEHRHSKVGVARPRYIVACLPDQYELSEYVELQSLHGSSFLFYYDGYVYRFGFGESGEIHRDCYLHYIVDISYARVAAPPPRYLAFKDGEVRGLKTLSEADYDKYALLIVHPPSNVLHRAVQGAIQKDLVGQRSQHR